MKRNNNSFTGILLLSAAVLLLLELVRPSYTDHPLRNDMIHTILTRTVGGVLFFLLIRQNGGRVFGLNCDRRALFCVIPALAVAVNNFPLVGLLTGVAEVDAGAEDIVLLAAQSFTVGLFEEMTFRGFLFPFVLRKYQGYSVFLPTVLSSAVFAAVHLVNLFSGASPAAVLLQTGYSFLIGGMCAVVLLKTRCIWICVFLHGLYNFGGSLVPTLGSGTIWNPVSVTITAVLGILVLWIMLRILAKVADVEIHAIL